MFHITDTKRIIFFGVFLANILLTIKRSQSLTMGKDVKKFILGTLIYACSLSASASLIGSSIDIVFDETAVGSDCLSVLVVLGSECSIADVDDDSIDIDVRASSFIAAFFADDGVYTFSDNPADGTFDIVLSGLNLFDSPALAISSIGVTKTGAIGELIDVSLTGANQITLVHNDPIRDCVFCGFVEVQLNYETASVPAPVTLALLALGLAGLGFSRRKA